MKTKLKTEDEEQGGAGAGTGVPERVARHELEPLSIDRARALVAIARNGGGVATVLLPDIVTAVTAAKLVELGLIETLISIGKERPRAKLTAFGVQRLIEAHKIVSAGSAMSR